MYIEFPFLYSPLSLLQQLCVSGSSVMEEEQHHHHLTQEHNSTDTNNTLRHRTTTPLNDSMEEEWSPTSPKEPNEDKNEEVTTEQYSFLTFFVQSSKPHQFEEVHFSKFTYCQWCNGFIWGLGKQGYQCKGASISPDVK